MWAIALVMLGDIAYDTLCNPIFRHQARSRIFPKRQTSQHYSTPISVEV